MPFRCSAKRFFLTFPKCDLDPEIVCLRAEEEWKDSLKWIVIGREKHQDGDLHLHVALCFGVTKNWFNPKWADLLTGQHGNYQAMKNQRKCLEYITKDGDFLERGISVKSVLAKHHPQAALVEEAIAEGQTMTEIQTSFPGYVIAHLKDLEYYVEWKKRMSIQLQDVCWDPVHARVPDVGTTSEATSEIANWLNLNICQPRAFKAAQLWIFGGPNLGKSSLVEWLAKLVRVYFLPLDEGFYSGWSNSTYDLVVLDEYKGQKSITWLNQFLQGSQMSIAVKGSQRLKKDNVPVIILSNFSPRDCYWKATLQALAPLLTRLKVVEVDQFIEIESQ